MKTPQLTMAKRNVFFLLHLICFMVAFSWIYNHTKIFWPQNPAVKLLAEKRKDTKQGHVKLFKSHIKSSGPYQYPDEVDLRIIVLTYNRDKSLKKCLDSLQNIHIDSHKVAMEIWIDRMPSHEIHLATLEMVKEFHWKHGPVTVHVWSEHVGIYGQWIDTWRPREDSQEMALFLEDDVDVSPYFYRWLRAAHAFYGHRKDIGTYGLASNNVQISTGENQGKFLKMINRESVYLYRILISWGMSPKPDVWRKFQDWFYETMEKYPKYKPYTKGATLQTSWYRRLESAGKANTMWTLWFINFCDLNHLYTLHPNIANVIRGGTFLAMNRKEKGLHFNGHTVMFNTTPHLLLSWSCEFVIFPEEIVKYGYNGLVEKV